MQFNIKVIGDVELGSDNTKAGKPYSFVDVNFKRLDNGKVEAKRLVDWNKDIYNRAKAFKAGDEASVTIEKDTKGYWQWTNISTGSLPDSGTPTASKDVAPQRAPAATTGKTVTSNYETAAERAIRQRLIVAQSSLSNAIEFVTSQKVKADIDTLQEYADTLFFYVMSKGNDKPILKDEGHKSFADFENDIPE